MGAGYINTILCSTVLVPNNICGIGSLTHCFNRFKSGLTHCLINLFPSVLGGYTSFLCAGGNSQSEKGGLFVELLFCFSDKLPLW